MLDVFSLQSYFPYNCRENIGGKLAGFISGDGCLAIGFKKKKISKENTTLYMEICISQKSDNLLILIKERFGGSISFDKKSKAFRYSNKNFANVAKFISYLDRFQLIVNKLRQYFLWRSAYLMVQSKQHLTTSGKELLESIRKKIIFIRSKKLYSPESKARETLRLEALLIYNAKKLKLLT